ncbi:AAR2 domain-containing protein [Glonium stellatum]|uniref:AAR2 domain-containing protein n=1 Tax=Glonium stellatum TaxID=574774 RepID=A0A8E2EVT1_9PEZI|nr:AAR2 domain-containing protein [Glonium stellatum]
MDPLIPTACVLILNLPPSSLTGIDLLSFTTTPRFYGVKNLPPGWHFIFTSSSTSLSVRHGAWFYVSAVNPSQIFIKKWDPATEEFVAESSRVEHLRWRANLGSIWREGLTPYRQYIRRSNPSLSSPNTEEESGDWKQLTTHITPELLSRITGATPDHWSLTSTSSAVQDFDDIPGLTKTETGFQSEKELFFLPIDLKRTWREGATGRERTQAAQDRSWALGELINKHCTGDGLREREFQVLGELQFTFLMVLTLNNHSCLEQWKRLLGLLLTCGEGVKERPELFMEVLCNLRVQLSHSQDAESGLFDMSDEGGSMLKSLLRRFRRGLEEDGQNASADIIDELNDLEGYLKMEYGWELDDSFVKQGILQLEDGERVEMDVGGFEEENESGEYAPVIVELTPSQIDSMKENASEHKIRNAVNEDSFELGEIDARY